ncbi:MAG: hypothetical protein FJY82_13890, partial [Candidatus Aminicenantes bacterium]|nr:hypothetical protein [Candidatus Aminicenantes bacterium]
MIFLIFLAVRLGVFLSTHHVQEDAMIFLSYAKNFLPKLSFTFNPGDPPTGPTSYIYLVILAPLYELFGNSVWIAVTVLNASLQWLTVWLWSMLLLPGDGRKKRLLLSVFIFVPVSLLLSYTGMEMALVLLAVTLGFWAIEKGRFGLLLGLFLLFPFLRPDTVAFTAALALTYAHKTKNAKRTLVLIGSLLGGLVLLSVFNLAVFGTAANHSLRAKIVAYGLNRTPAAWVRNALRNLAEVFGLVTTRYLAFLGLKIAVAGAYFGALLGLLRIPQTRRFGFFSLAVVVGLPMAYAFGPTFPWYLFPSEFFLALTIVAGLMAALVRVRGLRIALIAGLVLLTLVQAAVSKNYGFQNSRYLPSIGRYIRDRTPPEARVFLEPAGCLAFHTERGIIDEVGLIDPAVTRYRERFGVRWHDPFLRDHRPEVIVSRTDLRRETLFRDFLVSADWFNREYQLARHFTYREFRERARLRP